MRSIALVVAFIGTTGCAAEWTYASALEPVRVWMDKNADGAVDKSEYDAVSFAAPEYGRADADGDADLSHSELWDLILSQSPATFDGGMPMADPSAIDMSAYFETSYEERVLRDLMAFLREEVAVREARADMPTRRQIEIAARSRRLDAPAVVEVLRQLRVLHDDLGLTFPPKLVAQLDALDPADAE